MLFNPDPMKRLIALSVLGLFLTSCGGGPKKEDSDLLDGILNNPGGGSGDSEETVEYEEPVSSGPSILPPEDEATEDELTEDDNE